MSKKVLAIIPARGNSKSIKLKNIVNLNGKPLIEYTINAAKRSKQIDDFIEEESKRYKDPDQYKKWITGQPQQLEQFRMIVLEEQLVEKLQNVLKSKKKVIKFSELADRQV